MSDSFADLWNSTAPSKPHNLPLSQQKKGPALQQKPTQDVFALLSQSSTPSYGGNRSNLSSTLNPSRPVSRPITPSMSSNNGIPRPSSSLSSTTNKSSSSADAFGDLFSGISSKSNGITANMTIAERAALAQKQRFASQSSAASAVSKSRAQDQWAGLDALGGGSFSNSSKDPPPATITTIDDDDWGLGDFGAPSKPSSQPPPSRNASPLDSQGASSSKPQPTIQTKSGSLWDLDDFSAPSKPQEHVDSPDFDFDFGNREDRDFTPPPKPSNGRVQHNHDEDDILGMLSKPVEAVRAAQQQQQQRSTDERDYSPTSISPPPRQSHPTRTSSPPPHILGQIVEMGFSVSQAKAALARTETGTDVQAALDMLLNESNDNRSPSPERRRPPPAERGYSDEAQSRRRQAPPQRDESSGTPNAEKLIAQASEIGLSMLSKASLFWKEGKEKVQKAYEEASGTPAIGGSRERDTRPKWMQEAAAARGSEPPMERRKYTETTTGGFRDDDEHESSSTFRDDTSSAPGSSNTLPPQPQQQRVQQPEPDLFSLGPTPEPKIYVSPFRRKKADISSAPPAPAAAAPSFVAAAPPPKPKRRLPLCAPSTLPRVHQHKTKGTDAFKLGQFSVAVEEYTKAITLLPTGHLLLVPLHTNRAIAQIRCGECKAAIEDASGALSIIGSIQEKSGWESWHPSDEDGGWDLQNNESEPDGRGGYTVSRAKGGEWSDSWGRGVDLKDGWVKAVKRRAEALEGLEKWKDARKDWEILAGGGSRGWVDAHTRQEAVRGLGRCKKMLDGDGEGSSAPPLSKPKPKPRPAAPAAPANAAPSVAVKAYRAQVSALEAEDALKHSLKDSVEEKLQAWKKGKENNLRALLASLDTVLWEAVIKDMGKKPGMADLVSGGGVKKWYMKAVSRVHPDKLNANNSTIEQRMIAGGVFGALNEAWLAFKQ